MIRTSITRRTATKALAGAAAAFSLSAKPFQRALGAQLYTVRDIIGKDEDGTLKRIADIGYTELETTGRDDLDRIEPILAKYNLKAVSSHLDVPTVPTGKIQASVDKAKKYGVKYLVHPYVQPSDRGSTDGYAKLCDKLNAAGAICKEAGIALCYHNHAFEFGGHLGERAIDTLNAHLDKSLVFFELDLFWLSVAGQDPVKILKQFKGRAPLVHLKDKLAGAPVMYDERVSKETFKEVGSGELNFVEILKTAETTGVKHYFVEQDQTPGDPVQSLAKSYKYLRGLAL